MSRYTDLFQNGQEVELIQPQPTVEKKSKLRSESDSELIMPENSITENLKPAKPLQQLKTFALD